MRWTDVDWDRKTAAIRQTVVPLTKAAGRGREGRILPRTKTDGARVVELDAATVAMLRAWRAKQAKERLLMGAGFQDNDLVFCRLDGLPYHPEAFSKTFDRRVRQAVFAELPTLRLHDLRHTWATLALAAGVDRRHCGQATGARQPSNHLGHLPTRGHGDASGGGREGRCAYFRCLTALVTKL